MLASNSLASVPVSSTTTCGASSNFSFTPRGDRAAHAVAVGAAAHLDRQAQEVVAAFVQRLGTEVADLEVAEDEVLEVLVAEVDAAHLEEAARAVRVLDAREDRDTARRRRRPRCR